VEESNIAIEGLQTLADENVLSAACMLLNSWEFCRLQAAMGRNTSMEVSCTAITNNNKYVKPGTKVLQHLEAEVQVGFEIPSRSRTSTHFGLLPPFPHPEWQSNALVIEWNTHCVLSNCSAVTRFYRKH
jgi:hypothetical protein